jgi:hypothetical protein
MRAWTALTRWVVSDGLEWIWRRIFQDFSWALARSPGARSRACAALTAFWLADRGRYRPVSGFLRRERHGTLIPGAGPGWAVLRHWPICQEV